MARKRTDTLWVQAVGEFRNVGIFFFKKEARMRRTAITHKSFFCYSLDNKSEIELDVAFSFSKRIILAQRRWEDVGSGVETNGAA